MIVSRLCGGIGNQMFQYAMGYRLAQDRNVPFRMDISGFAVDPRPYALTAFRIEATPLTEKESARVKPGFLRLRRKFPWLEPFLPRPMPYVREKQFFFDPSIMDSRIPCYLDGYWQTEKYFASVADAVRRQFQLAVPMTDARRAVADAIKGEGNAISVHVRRGDYVSNPVAHAVHGTCAPEWYERAMNAMAQKIPTPHFFVFSDDPEWARAHLPSRWPATFVDPQSDRRDFEDMHLMALCRHHIIANSSFSWWGAWLNPSSEKHVIAPLRWFDQSPHDTRDLTPPAWVRM